METPSHVLSKKWSVSKTLKKSYTGGKAGFALGGDVILCMKEGDVSFLSLAEGVLTRTLQGENIDHPESYSTFCIRPNGNEIVTASRNQQLRHWSIVDQENPECKRSWRGHEGPVISMDFDSTGTLLATGSADKTIKVWDVDKGFATHNFKGHTGIVNMVKFYKDAITKQIMLVSSSEDSTIKVWNLSTSSCVASLNGHLSTPTCVVISNDGNTLISSGRDKVINVWNLRDFSLLRSHPVYEMVEGMIEVDEEIAAKINNNKDIHLNSGSSVVATVGDKGIMRIWKVDYTNYKNKSSNVKPEFQIVLLGETSSSDKVAKQFTSITHCQSLDSYMITTSDQNIIFIDYSSLSRNRQIIGNNDDVIAIKYIPNNDRKTSSRNIVVATNSENLRIFNLDTFNASFLIGHESIVLAMDISADGKWLVTSSRDNTCRLWNIQSNVCIAVCTGHTMAIGSIIIPKKPSSCTSKYYLPSYIISGSVDKTIKVWDSSILDTDKIVNMNYLEKPVELKTKSNTLAHDKDINSLAISPNDSLLASASQDKSIKLWNTATMSLTGVLSGHKRGVWSIVFSPVDKCLASASADRTIKLWNVTDFTCLKTFEGHTASVLQVYFVTAGLQLLSSGADGLMKLWTIRSNECVGTFDGHTDRVWSLAVRSEGGECVSGGGDSLLNVWKDVTIEEEDKVRKEEDEKLLKEQDLLSAMRSSNYEKALNLAFELNHPGRLRTILNDIISPVTRSFKSIDTELNLHESFNKPRNKPSLDSIVKTFDAVRLSSCFEFIREWNTRGRDSLLAQELLHSILNNFSPKFLLSVPNVKSILPGLLSYTERHMKRMDKLIQTSFLLDHTLMAMKGGVGDVFINYEDNNNENSNNNSNVYKRKSVNKEEEKFNEEEEKGEEEEIIREEIEIEDDKIEIEVEEEREEEKEVLIIKEGEKKNKKKTPAKKENKRKSVDEGNEKSSKKKKKISK